jgi:hypothetical protein
MITLTREEAQQVLDALKWFEQRFACTHLELIETIRARLSAPERAWQGLTEQEHANIAVEAGCASADWVFYGAAVERALKEKNT